MSDASTPDTDFSRPWSLYERLGGQAALARVVDVFYQRVLADEQLAPFFAGVDMGRLRRHQAALLAAALGGPDRYTGADITQAHVGLDIGQDDFWRVCGHLVDVLLELGVTPDVVDEVASALVAMRPRIVTDPAPAAGAGSPGTAPTVPSWVGPTPPTGVQAGS